MDSRLYPISEEVFHDRILPIIKKHTTLCGGRPPKISHYKCFCAILKMFMVSVPWPKRIWPMAYNIYAV